jgi:sRNA-binding regulator protein Hfq
MTKRILSEPNPNQPGLLASAATAAVLEQPRTEPVAPPTAAGSGSLSRTSALHAAKLALNGTQVEVEKTAPAKRTRVHAPTGSVRHNVAISSDDHGSNHQAELFYLQKQIQQQTQMIFILEDGSRIQGVVEWYDRSSIKVRGKSKVLIYKSAIKYLYKAGEIGTAPSV